ncbi:MAG: sigma-54 dependent transcriptional regulator [Thermodesulfobacteriota bacterium]
MFPSILVVDDEKPILQTLGGVLEDEGYQVVFAQNGYDAMKSIAQESPDLVLLDIWMPGMDGIETLKEIRRDFPALPVVIITGHATVETAVSAIKLGAYDFIEKPLSVEKVVVTINNALNFRRLEEEYRYLRKKTLEKHSISGMSEPVREMLRQIEIAAPTDAWVLITGENGTGKELAARTVHNLSNRSEHAMLTVNCAATSKDSIERELFGYERGAFPGAERKKMGRLEMANQGTLFFDDIGEMDMKTQGKLLRVLTDGSFSRLGGGRPRSTDVRVIAATSKNLEEEIAKGNFREDLYFRVNVIPIHVPPLRERKEDIPILLSAFLAEFAAENGAPPKTLSPETLASLSSYSWPGNVRELKNLAERLVITVDGPVIEPRHLPITMRKARPGAATMEELFEIRDLGQATRAFENLFISRALSRHENDVVETARAIGLDAGSLRRRLKSIPRP